MERRNCFDVIKLMISIIPETEEKLLKDLKWNLEDSFYKAPEESTQWERTMRTLQTHIPIPKFEWEYTVLSIFTTKTVEELKELFKNKQP